MLKIFFWKSRISKIRPRITCLRGQLNTLRYFKNVFSRTHKVENPPKLSVTTLTIYRCKLSLSSFYSAHHDRSRHFWGFFLGGEGGKGVLNIYVVDFECCTKTTIYLNGNKLIYDRKYPGRCENKYEFL